MSQVIVAQRMWQRRDTAANWEAKNPILNSGEWGIEEVPLPGRPKAKLGDGVTPWISLPYYGTAGVGPAMITASFDGGGVAVQTGSFADVYVPYAFQIDRVVLLADPAGGVSIDIRRCPRATYPPTTADTICGGAPPAIVTGQQAVITSFPGWTTTIDADSAFRFVVLTASSVTRATLQIEGTKL